MLAYETGKIGMHTSRSACASARTHVITDPKEGPEPVPRSGGW
jgi:hypothetical protein